MPRNYNEAKLIHMHTDHKQRLLEIQDEVSKVGGDVSLNQLIREAIDLLFYAHKDEIVELHRPKRLKDLIKRN